MSPAQFWEYYSFPNEEYNTATFVSLDDNLSFAFFFLFFLVLTADDAETLSAGRSS